MEFISEIRVVTPLLGILNFALGATQDLKMIEIYFYKIGRAIRHSDQTGLRRRGGPLDTHHASTHESSAAHRPRELGESPANWN